MSCFFTIYTSLSFFQKRVTPETASKYPVNIHKNSWEYCPDIYHATMGVFVCMSVTFSGDPVRSGYSRKTLHEPYSGSCCKICYIRFVSCNCRLLHKSAEHHSQDSFSGHTIALMCLWVVDTKMLVSVRSLVCTLYVRMKTVPFLSADNG